MLAQEQTFGEYRIERRVGVGRVGAIYRATHLRLGRPVALKVVPPERTTDAETRARLVRESVLVAKLDHPNIVPIYEAGEIEGSLFIAMRWVDGTDLETTLARSGALPPAQALRIAQQVAGALDAAHAARLLHRDVKPANVLLTPSGHVYLTDFGLTKRATSNTALTMTGQILGTIDYVAPEQVQGDPVDARADIYALAAVTFEMLTGRIPFAGPGPTAKLWAHLNDDPPSAHALRPDLPPAVDAVLARGMAKAPADRYQTAGRFARALKEAIAPSRTAAAPPPAPGHAAAPPAPVPAPPAPAPAPAPAAGPDDPAEPGAAAPAPPATTARPRGGRLRGGARALRGRSAPRPRGRLVLLAAAVLAASLAAVAAATFLGDGGEDTTGPAVRLAATPTALATGGGRIVAVDGPGRTVNVIVAQGAAVRSRRLGRAPTGVAATDERIWVTDPRAGTVTGLAGATLDVTDRPIAVGRDVRDVAVAGGVVWTTHPARRAVVRTDPATRVPAVVDLGATPAGIAASGGDVWVATGGAGDGRVVRLDGGTGAVAGAPVRVGPGPRALAAGGGRVWVATAGDDAVTPIDARTGRRAGAPIAVGGDPVALAADARGVWVARADGVVRRFAADGRPLGDELRPGGRIAALASGRAGTWAAGSAGGGRVVRLAR